MYKHKYLENVTTLELDEKKCIGCGLCEKVCPHRVFLLKNKKAEIVDKNSCMECGACSLNCPVLAISVNSGVGCATGLIYDILKQKGFEKIAGKCCGTECSCSSENIPKADTFSRECCFSKKINSCC